MGSLLSPLGNDGGLVPVAWPSQALTFLRTRHTTGKTGRRGAKIPSGQMDGDLLDSPVRMNNALCCPPSLGHQSAGTDVHNQLTT